MLDQTHPQIRIAADEVHAEFRIYKPCGHQHNPDDPGVVDIDDVGLVCADGYEYSICRACCAADGDGQTEECADGHDHDACWPCRPLRSLAHRLSVTHAHAFVAMANGDTPLWAARATEAAGLYRELLRHLPTPPADGEQTGGGA